jgi:hypothetical protein
MGPTIGEEAGKQVSAPGPAPLPQQRNKWHKPSDRRDTGSSPSRPREPGASDILLERGVQQQPEIELQCLKIMTPGPVLRGMTKSPIPSIPTDKELTTGHLPSSRDTRGSHDGARFRRTRRRQRRSPEALARGRTELSVARLMAGRRRDRVSGAIGIIKFPAEAHICGLSRSSVKTELALRPASLSPAV